MNILVATPGRLLQHMDETPGFDATGLQVLVLDEADRILDMVKPQPLAQTHCSGSPFSHLTNHHGDAGGSLRCPTRWRTHDITCHYDGLGAWMWY